MGGGKVSYYIRALLVRTCDIRTSIHIPTLHIYASNVARLITNQCLSYSLTIWVLVAQWLERLTAKKPEGYEFDSRLGQEFKPFSELKNFSIAKCYIKWHYNMWHLICTTTCMSCYFQFHWKCLFIYTWMYWFVFESSAHQAPHTAFVSFNLCIWLFSLPRCG